MTKILAIFKIKMSHSETKLSCQNSAFKKLNNNKNVNHSIEDNMKDIFETQFSLEDERSYDYSDFMLAQKFTGNIRLNNPSKLLTINLIQTYKKCNSNFVFEEVNVPRRELTEPSEGNLILNY